jgi:uncharacterized YccA/Bax inhibitor family protein
MTFGGASVAIGWKISCEVMLAMTVLAGVVAGAVTEIVVVGTEIELLKRGPLVGAPVLLRLVNKVPRVPWFVVLRDGRICAVPEVVDFVVTDTLGVTVDVLTDDVLISDVLIGDVLADPKNIPPGACDVVLIITCVSVEVLTLFC